MTGARDHNLVSAGGSPEWEQYKVGAGLGMPSDRLLAARPLVIRQPLRGARPPVRPAAPTSENMPEPAGLRRPVTSVVAREADAQASLGADGAAWGGCPVAPPLAAGPGPRKDGQHIHQTNTTISVAQFTETQTQAPIPSETLHNHGTNNLRTMKNQTQQKISPEY